MVRRLATTKYHRCFGGVWSCEALSAGPLVVLWPIRCGEAPERAAEAVAPSAGGRSKKLDQDCCSLVLPPVMRGPRAGGPRGAEWRRHAHSSPRNCLLRLYPRRCGGGGGLTVISRPIRHLQVRAARAPGPGHFPPWEGSRLPGAHAALNACKAVNVRTNGVEHRCKVHKRQHARHPIT